MPGSTKQGLNEYAPATNHSRNHSCPELVNASIYTSSKPQSPTVPSAGSVFFRSATKKFGLSNNKEPQLLKEINKLQDVKNVSSDEGGTTANGAKSTRDQSEENKSCPILYGLNSGRENITRGPPAKLSGLRSCPGRLDGKNRASAKPRLSPTSVGDKIEPDASKVPELLHLTYEKSNAYESSVTLSEYEENSQTTGSYSSDGTRTGPINCAESRGTIKTFNESSADSKSNSCHDWSIGTNSIIEARQDTVKSRKLNCFTMEDLERTLDDYYDSSTDSDSFRNWSIFTGSIIATCQETANSLKGNVFDAPEDSYDSSDENESFNDWSIFTEDSAASSNSYHGSSISTKYSAVKSRETVSFCDGTASINGFRSDNIYTGSIDAMNQDTDTADSHSLDNACSSGGTGKFGTGDGITFNERGESIRLAPESNCSNLLGNLHLYQSSTDGKISHGSGIFTGSIELIVTDETHSQERGGIGNFCNSTNAAETIALLPTLNMHFFGAGGQTGSTEGVRTQETRERPTEAEVGVEVLRLGKVHLVLYSDPRSDGDDSTAEYAATNALATLEDCEYRGLQQAFHQYFASVVARGESWPPSVEYLSNAKDLCLARLNQCKKYFG